jgi:Holliday junction DNA helicase RuvA
MIGQLTGKVLTCAPDRVLLDVTGVGYLVQIPLSTFYALAHDTGAIVTLHVHTHVREDALQLFGFATLEERATFVQLIGISGVGPKLALSILSGIGVGDLRGAVKTQDRGRLQKIPGVGKKTAERLLLELRDRLGIEPVADGDGGAATAETDGGMRADAISALTNLGYSPNVAGRAVDRALASDEGAALPLEEVLRGALSGLVR